MKYSLESILIDFYHSGQRALSFAIFSVLFNLFIKNWLRILIKITDDRKLKETESGSNKILIGQNGL